MNTRTTLTITMALGLALGGNAGSARAAAGATRGEDISTVQAINPEQHLVVLADGLQLVATDPSVLAALHEGEIVKVAFKEEGGRLVIDRVEQVDREPSPYDQMKVGEGNSTGARPIKPGSGTFHAGPPSSGEGAFGDSRGVEAP